jgi:hypothetical protein
MHGTTVLCSMCPLQWLPLPIEPEDSGRVKRYDSHTKAQLDVLRLSDIGLYAYAQYVGSEH